MGRKHLYNSYFLVPFLAWLAAGAVLLLCYDKRELFEAVNGNNTSTLDTLMYAATHMGEAWVVVPVLLLLVFLPSNRSWWFFGLTVACNVLPMVVQQLLKSYFDAPRPLKYFDNAAWIHRLPEWPELYTRSFPSGHTEGAFSLFCFAALLLPERYRQWGFMFFLLALTVAYSRLYVAAHFFADVYAGSIVGVVVTTTVYYVMQRWVKPIVINN